MKYLENVCTFIGAVLAALIVTLIFGIRIGVVYLMFGLIISTIFVIIKRKENSQE